MKIEPRHTMKKNMINILFVFFTIIQTFFYNNIIIADTEPDNNFNTTPDPITIGQNVYGYINAQSGDPFDFYILNIAGDCSISITASSSGPSNVILNNLIFFQNGCCCGSGLLGAMPTNGNTWNLGRIPAGTYLILIKDETFPHYDFPYSFVVSVDYLSVANDIEPNDIPSSALPFYPNTTITGHLLYRTSCSSFDSYDYYKIHIPTSGNIDITAHFDTTLYEINPGSSEPIIELTDSVSGSLIASQHLTPPPIFDLHISYNNINPGTYYVWIRNYGLACGYTLSNSFTPYSYLSTVSANLKLFIQGFYVGDKKMVAVSSPGLNPLICDTINVELHSSSPPYNSVYSATGVLDVNGLSQIDIPNVLVNQDCYIVVLHRNSLQTWSKIPVRLNTYTINYDFSTAASKAYGNNLADLNDGNYALLSGDVDQNAIIDVADFSLIENKTSLFLTGYEVNDITGDLIIESSDFSLVENNLGRITMRP